MTMMSTAVTKYANINNEFWDAIYASCARIGLNPRDASIGFQLFQFWR